MGNTKFFTNHITNTLFDNIKDIIEGIYNFHAVVGYFRSSGYFKIRSEFEKCATPPKIQILIGINIDNIFRKHNKSPKIMTPNVKYARANTTGLYSTILTQMA